MKRHEVCFSGDGPSDPWTALRFERADDERMAWLDERIGRDERAKQATFPPRPKERDRRDLTHALRQDGTARTLCGRYLPGPDRPKHGVNVPPEAISEEPTCYICQLSRARLARRPGRALP